MKASAVSTNNGSCNSLGFIQLFYNDEHAMTLGVRQITVKTTSGTITTNYPVSTCTPVPGKCNEPKCRRVRNRRGHRHVGPAHVSSSVHYRLERASGLDQSLAGDWQYGGTGIPPTAVFGTWKAAATLVDQTDTPAVVTVTPDADPAQNHWNLGPGADPVPAPTPADEGYGTEARWDINTLGLISGHRYRVYFIVHDGDQNKRGGDCGQANWYFTLP